MANAPGTALERITDAVWDGGRRVRITFADGFAGVVDLTPLIEKGGTFSGLDDPETPSRVKIGGGGRFLVFPGGIDLCADALRLDADRAPRSAARSQAS